MHSIKFYIWDYIVGQMAKYMYRRKTIPEMRKFYEDSAKWVLKPHPSVKSTPLTYTIFNGEMIEPVDKKPKFTMLYLHGGGYVMGSTQGYRNFLSYFSYRADAQILSLDYRLAPEHPFPAGLDDSKAAYQWLLDNGYDPKKIVIAGDSAGGGLALALLQLLRDHEIPMPASAICLDPWVDLTGEAIWPKGKHEQETMVRAINIELFARSYAGRHDRNHGLISPLFGDLKGLPPLLIQASTEDSLIEQAVELEKRAKEQGVDVTFEIWQGMPHVWQVIFVPYVSESTQAIEHICKFIDETVHAKSKILI